MPLKEPSHGEGAGAENTPVKAGASDWPVLNVMTGAIPGAVGPVLGAMGSSVRVEVPINGEADRV